LLLLLRVLFCCAVALPLLGILLVGKEQQRSSQTLSQSIQHI